MWTLWSLIPHVQLSLLSLKNAEQMLVWALCSIGRQKCDKLDHCYYMYLINILVCICYTCIEFFLKELNEMLNLLLYFLQILNEVIFKIKDICTCPIWHTIWVQFYEKVYTNICYKWNFLISVISPQCLFNLNDLMKYKKFWKHF